MPIPFDMHALDWRNLRCDAVVPGQRTAVTWNLGHFMSSQGVMKMTGQLHTAAEAAGMLKVRESWLRTKAAARLIPCTFIGKHLRFSDDDIAEIMKAGARQPVTARERESSRRTA